MIDKQLSNWLTDYVDKVSILTDAIQEVEAHVQRGYDSSFDELIGEVDLSEYGDLDYLTATKLAQSLAGFRTLTDAMEDNDREAWARLYGVER